MKVELMRSSHATEMRGNRSKERPVEWSDDADCFQAWSERTLHYVNIGCRRWHRFLFNRKDFVEIVKCMLSTLPLSHLADVNGYLSLLLSKKAEGQTAELIASQSKVAAQQKELQASLDAKWRLQYQNGSLQRSLDSLAKRIDRYETT